MTMDFYGRRELYRKSLLAFLNSQTELHLLSGMYGNIGDHLIWAGTRDLLSSGGLVYKDVPMALLDGFDRQPGALVVPGSGAFDLLWHEWLPDTIIKASRIFEKVIILPSSYDMRVPIVAQCLALPNVYAFAREVNSYRVIKDLGRAALFFDCATYLNAFEEGLVPKENSPKNGPQLVAFRDDKGSLLSSSGFVPNPDLNDDISLTKSNLDDWINSIEQVTSVVTDRLHVALAAVLLGKRLIYLDPYNKKLSTYFAYTFRDTFNAVISPTSLDWLNQNKYVIPAQETK